MGAAVHADDLRTTAASAEAVSQQNAVINQFARDSCLRLNTSKTEVVKISPFSQEESCCRVGKPHAACRKCCEVPRSLVEH